jgi:hypothetical protein
MSRVLIGRRKSRFSSENSEIAHFPIHCGLKSSSVCCSQSRPAAAAAASPNCSCASSSVIATRKRDFQEKETFKTEISYFQSHPFESVSKNYDNCFSFASKVELLPFRDGEEQSWTQSFLFSESSFGVVSFSSDHRSKWSQLENSDFEHW